MNSPRKSSNSKKVQPKTPAKRQQGGQRANRNGIRHGLMSGSLPRDCRYIEVRLNVFRRTIEDLILKKKGEVSLQDAGLVQTICRLEKTAMLAQRWLGKADKSLKPLERLEFSKAISKASVDRDRCIAMLGLDLEEEAESLPWLLKMEDQA